MKSPNNHVLRVLILREIGSLHCALKNKKPKNIPSLQKTVQTILNHLTISKHPENTYKTKNQQNKKYNRLESYKVILSFK